MLKLSTNISSKIERIESAFEPMNPRNGFNPMNWDAMIGDAMRARAEKGRNEAIANIVASRGKDLGQGGATADGVYKWMSERLEDRPVADLRADYEAGNTSYMQEAASRAVEANPFNAPIASAMGYMGADTAGGGLRRGALGTAAMTAGAQQLMGLMDLMQGTQETQSVRDEQAG